MGSQNSDLEPIANTMERAVQKSNGTTGNRTIFTWRRKNNPQQECEKEKLVDAKAMDHNPSSSGVSFFKNIKKCLHLKNLYKSKRKINVCSFLF